MATAPTAMPSWPAMPAALGGSRSEPRTSIRSSAQRRIPPPPRRDSLRTPPTAKCCIRETQAPGSGAKTACGACAHARARESRVARCRSMRNSAESSATGASSPYCASILKLNCASKIFFGMLLNDSRPTVCCCSSSTPAVPCSLAGSKIWITERRTGYARASRDSTMAIAMAAGCAIDVDRILRRAESGRLHKRRANQRVGMVFRACVRSMDPPMAAAQFQCPRARLRRCPPASPRANRARHPRLAPRAMPVLRPAR